MTKKEWEEICIISAKLNVLLGVLEPDTPHDAFPKGKDYFVRKLTSEIYTIVEGMVIRKIRKDAKN